MPDYPSLVQEFVWGFDDRVPELSKTHKFLMHWRANIDAVVSEVMLSIDHSQPRTWKSLDEVLRYN